MRFFLSSDAGPVRPASLGQSITTVVTCSAFAVSVSLFQAVFVYQMSVLFVLLPFGVNDENVSGTYLSGL